MASEEPEYTVSQLEELTGISRRTIHFYVKEGVIAPPDGVAGGARYGEEHLLRLKLTKELQKSHLKLSGIREAMDRLSLDQMRSMLRKAKSSAKTWDNDSLERWLEERIAGIQGGEGVGREGGPERPPAEEGSVRGDDGVAREPDLPYPVAPDSVGGPEPAWNQSWLDLARGSRHGSGASGGGRQAGDRHTWERVEIAPGLELLVRSDLVPRYQSAIQELARHVGRRP